MKFNTNPQNKRLIKSETQRIDSRFQTTWKDGDDIPKTKGMLHMLVAAFCSKEIMAIISFSAIITAKFGLIFLSAFLTMEMDQ